MENRKLIIVEGNIAAGKSTLCQDLATILNYGLFIEPTDDNPYLEKYYKEPKKYAFKMQIWFLRQRFTTYCQAIRFLIKGSDATGKKINGVILDRSIFSDSVFAEQNFVDGNFSREQYNEYLNFRNTLLSKVILPHVMLYLNASPETCYQRIHKLRKRAGEEVIPLAYLTGLSNCYQTLIDELEAQPRTSVVLTPWDTFGKSQDICNAILKTLLEQQHMEQQRKEELLATSSTTSANAVDIDDELLSDGGDNISFSKLLRLKEIVASDEQVLKILNDEEEKSKKRSSSTTLKQQTTTVVDRCKSPLTIGSSNNKVGKLLTPVAAKKKTLVASNSSEQDVKDGEMDNASKRIISP
jgi:deoxyadenosine/deoxycytidine kinase